MRSPLLLCSAAAALVVISSVVACATSEGDSATPDPGGAAPIPDGDAADPEQKTDSRQPDAQVEEPKCSAAGWCRTALPDEDLSMKDLWPVGDRAFAIADSPTLGVRTLEWSNADESWVYIDDGAPNARLRGNHLGRIWAPTENEVYYAAAPGHIYHGIRPTPPATRWTWTTKALGDSVHAGSVTPLTGYLCHDRGNCYPRIFEGVPDRYSAAGVWGTSSDDVYAWFGNTIYHLEGVAGGAREWIPDYIANDSEAPNEQLFFAAAAGVGADSIWFSGARTRQMTACSLLVRKTSAGYKKVADGVLTDIYAPCTERAGYMFIPGHDQPSGAWMSAGWFTDIQAVSATEIVGLRGAHDLVSVSYEQGSYSHAVSPIPYEVSPVPFLSLWLGPQNLWLSAFGLVIQSPNDAWNDRTYRISTISLSGAPLGRAIYQVRGASNTNLWAIGVRNALHKTTP